MLLTELSEKDLIAYICKCLNKPEDLLSITDTYIHNTSKIIILHHKGHYYGNDNISNPEDRYIVEINNEKGMRMVGKLSERPEFKYVSELSDTNGIYQSLKEGTHIRMYKINNKIFLSSNKKIDITNSFWDTNVTFGKMLDDCISNMKIKLEIMDEMCYHLIMSHPFNQLINKDVVEPKIYHIATFKFSKWSMNNIHNMRQCIYRPSIFPQLETISYKVAKKNLFVENKPVLYVTNDNVKVILTTDKINELYVFRGENIQDVYVEFMKNEEKGNGSKYLNILPYSYKDLKIGEYVNNMYDEYLTIVQDIIVNDDLDKYKTRFSRKKIEILQEHIELLKSKIDYVDVIPMEFKATISKLEAYKVMKTKVIRCN